MRPLIDLDILLYEVGGVGQYVDEETKEIVMKSFDVVADAFDQKIKEIEGEVWGTEPPLLFMTHNKQLYKAKEKTKARKLKSAKIKLERALVSDKPKANLEELQEVILQLEPSKYVPNFRDAVAKKKEYKGNRKPNRPLHYENLVAYVKAKYEVIEAEGLEADDLLAVYQVKAEPLTTIICSRDKDLKIVPGMHFGWACGLQQQFGPEQVTELGWLKMPHKKLTGVGLKFFYAQMIMGDSTDNIPGLPRQGPTKAFKILEQCNDEAELFEAVSGAYKAAYTTSAEEEAGLVEHLWHREMNEQAQLLWMVQELDEDDKPIYWEMYDER